VKILIRSWFGLGALLVLTVAAQAQSSPAGTWSYSNNGYTGIMTLVVDSSGEVTGSMTDKGEKSSPVKGFWDSSALKLTFYRAINGTTSQTPPDFLEVFTGYLFPCSNAAPHPLCLAGSFEAFAGNGATATRTVFGWFAGQTAP